MTREMSPTDRRIRNADDLGGLGGQEQPHPDLGPSRIVVFDMSRPGSLRSIVQGGKEVLAEPFRRDALNMPVRYLDKYAHLNTK